VAEPRRVEDLPFATIAELAPRLAARDLSSVELVTAVLGRIERDEARLRAYVTVDPAAALAAAREADRALAAGAAPGPLHGIPVAVKDNIAVAAWPVTNGSPRMADHRPGFDAAAVERLRAAGAIIFGKTALHEWAMGGTCRHQPGGPVRNPWDPDRVPGGSSGGSAVAVAAGLAIAAIGTDGMGSIRTPASYCGVVGLKPSPGRTSRYGVLPPTSSPTDQLGPITRSVADAATLLAVLDGPDRRDPTSTPAPPGWSDPDHAAGRPLRLGIPHSPLDGDILPSVAAAVDASIDRVVAAGATRVDVAIPALADAALCGPATLTELQATLLPLALDGPDAFANPDLRYRVLANEFVRAADVRRARRLASRLRAAVLAALADVDVLVLPTDATPAFAIDATGVMVGDGSLVSFDVPGGQARITTRLTLPFNVARVPALSLPAADLVDGLPVGIQLVGRPWDEATLLRAAAAFEATGSVVRRPPAITS
jgi:aspartyl-tRNA(Asn)/glutamyl-tRNA(Gln) amidotransferase subunit A